MRYVEVSIPKSPLGPLTYSVPDEFPDAQEGMRALVPLGSRFVTGFITGLEPVPDPDLDIRPIADLVDSVNYFSETMLKLTKWIADYYLAEWVDILKIALPPGLDIKPQTIVTITDEGKKFAGRHPLLQILIEKKNLPLKEIYHLFGHHGTFSQIRSLEEEGLLQIIPSRTTIRRGYNMVEVIEASEPPENEKDLHVYTHLKEQSGPVSLEVLRTGFPNSAAILRRLEAKHKIRRFWLPAAAPKFWPQLQDVESPNPMQQEAIQQILEKKD